MAECRSCGRQVLWVATTKSRMPLDPEPNAQLGNVALLDGGHALVLTKAEAVSRRARGDRLYVSHFATCNARRAR